MAWFDAEGYDAARFVLQRGIAAVYVIAFLNALNQFRPLLGERGLLPVPRFVARVPWRASPSLFHWRYSDRLLVAVAVTGMLLAATVVVGLPQQGPPWVPALVLLVLWALYLSIVNVGQTFYAFGWESLLLEAGFLAMFLGSDDVAAPAATIWMFRWLVFRLELGAGLIKWRGDTVWRDLTATCYHHETQPMPNPASRYFHLLPRPLHKVEVAANHVTQLVVPFLLFAPQPVASYAAAAMIVTQGWLVLSGNFAWLNWLTMVLAFSAVDDATLRRLVPRLTDADHDPSPLWWVVVVLAATALVVVLSWWPARNLLSRRQVMNASFNRWHLVNAYGAFGSITRRRTEVVVDGTLDDDPGPDADWREYGFKGKPGDVRRVPRQYAPYHLRLDWLMWFLALGSPGYGWFTRFLVRLLQADPATLRLLRTDPFGGQPPRWVRARMFRYRFTTRMERRETGQWWVRSEIDELVRPQDLASLRGADG